MKPRRDYSEAIAMYVEQGLGLDAIAERTGINAGQLSQAFRRLGVAMRPIGVRRRIDIRPAVLNYIGTQGEATILEIGYALGFGRERIRDACNELRIAGKLTRRRHQLGDRWSLYIESPRDPLPGIVETALAAHRALPLVRWAHRETA